MMTVAGEGGLLDDLKSHPRFSVASANANDIVDSQNAVFSFRRNGDQVRVLSDDMHSSGSVNLYHNLGQTSDILSYWTTV